MKKTILKFLMITLLLAAGALIYIYAQKNFMVNNRETVSKTESEQEEPPDDTGVLTGDDPWQEMDKLVTAYYNKDGVSYKGLIKVIDANGDKEKVIEERKFEYSALGGQLYYKLGDIEFVTKPKLLLIADHANKVISLSENNGTNNSNVKFFDIEEFKTLMEKSNARAKVTQLGDQKILTIENIVDPQIQGYRIYYDPSTYRVNKMLIGMMRLSPLSDDNNGIDDVPGTSDEKKESSVKGDEQPFENEIDTYTYYVEIIYSETKLLNITVKKFRPEDKFITITKDKIELTQAFSEYQLLSNGNVINETGESKDEQE